MAKLLKFEAADRGKQRGARQLLATTTIPLREAIVDAWLDNQPINQIAARLRIDGATVQAVIRGWCEIWHRQAVISRVEAPAWLRERHREIEEEVWAEASSRGWAA